MSEKAFMTAPDGRTFTMEEWWDYLKEHDDSPYEDYIGMDGKVFEIDGFRFNVHGVCLNPHKFVVGDRKEGYYEVRTFRKWRHLDDRRVVWCFDLCGYNVNGWGIGHTTATEEDVILIALQSAAKSIQRSLDWYEDAIENEKDAEQDYHMGYAAKLARTRKLLALTKKEYDERCQLNLF